MNTRGRKKQTAATRVPPMAAESADVTVPETVEPVSPVKHTTRSRVTGSGSKTRTPTVSGQKLKKVPANPKVKKKVPVKKKPVTTDDDEFEDLTDPEVDFEELPVGIESELESNSEIERLKQRLAELEKVPQNSQFQVDVESTDRHKSSSPLKRSKPSEGRSFGTYDGKTDLDTFLARLENCSQYYSWSDADKLFHLKNSLIGPAGSIMKEVGPGGTLERTLELLQIRFGNRARRAKFLADLHNRKRRLNETLQGLYLDLCELRTNAFDDDPSEKFPDVYFMNIFVDALNDRELRRAILMQKPRTMEAAYNAAIEIEAIDAAYSTPLAESSRGKPRFRQLDRELVDSPEFPRVTESKKQTQVVGNQRLVELEELVRAQNAAINELRQVTGSLRQASYLPNTSYPGSQTNPQPMQNPRPENSGDQTFGGGSVSNYRDSSVPTADGNQRMRRAQCFNCGLPGTL